MTIKIEYPHVCRTEEEFNLIKTMEVKFGEEFNKPSEYPVVIVDVDWRYHGNGNDEVIFIFLYEKELNKILEQLKK